MKEIFITTKQIEPKKGLLTIKFKHRISTFQNRQKYV